MPPSNAQVPGAVFRRVVYRVLKAAGLIAARPPRLHESVERPDPLTVWERLYRQFLCPVRPRRQTAAHDCGGQFNPEEGSKAELIRTAAPGAQGS